MMADRSPTAPHVPRLDSSPTGKIPYIVAVAEPPTGRPLHRDPVANTAVGRTPDRPAPTASTTQLRRRLVVALGADDSHGALLLAHHIARCS
jgi:hypothetical protein